MTSGSVILGVVAAAALSVASSSAFAAQVRGRITQLGCHLYAEQCYVEIEGWPGGVPECPSSSIRWDGRTDVGRMHFGYFMAMYLAGKPVVLEVQGCFVPNVYPTFAYYNSR